jgi:hypothetical protein
MYIAGDFTTSEYDFYRVKGLLDTIGYNKLAEAFLGTYKSPDPLLS